MTTPIPSDSPPAGSHERIADALTVIADRPAIARWRLGSCGGEIREFELRTISDATKNLGTLAGEVRALPVEADRLRAELRAAVERAERAEDEAATLSGTVQTLRERLRQQSDDAFGK